MEAGSLTRALPGDPQPPPWKPEKKLVNPSPLITEIEDEDQQDVALNQFVKGLPNWLQDYIEAEKSREPGTQEEKSPKKGKKKGKGKSAKKK
mmetsp:Transcript_4782/g.8199  ORF Transcript_4782/g.8199 Transcript_4782/m.8199 type:complete len:92 (+) Transcript_4782:213-488(+)|eukprot:CAMPEP_0196657546 /NCGR_PEP_ID=MMETSP1086-20130531/24126_1 /TAXON_ID=77921 /ORGANISM="Cyanoptyche  gloeocystis , Strain SAG4.97" /LENGTH=91 /DNA_ID=CAMNT_0041990727 /DNA_START=193 /DNA_END=465 /DNA_ORIENTATION=+